MQLLPAAGLPTLLAQHALNSIGWADVVLLSLYTFGCHSLRHLVGGGLDLLARRPMRKKAWQCVTWCNKAHMRWAWFSLVWVALTDVYVRLVSMGVIHDFNTWGGH